MTRDSTAAEAEALEWIIRVQHPDFEDWNALSAWLAADPRDAEIFQRLAVLDDQLAADLASEPAGGGQSARGSGGYTSSQNDALGGTPAMSRRSTSAATRS